METTSRAPRPHQFTIRTLMLLILVAAVLSTPAVEGFAAVTLVLLVVFLGPFLLVRLGLWLFPVEP